MEVILRPATPADKNFILSTWLRNFRHSSNFAKSIRTSVYFEWHNKLLNFMLSRPTLRVQIVTDKETPDLIMGYIAYELQQDTYPNTTHVVHYVYVKKAVRGFGLGKKLLEACVPNDEYFDYTHVTNSVGEWLKKLSPRATFNPYRIDYGTL